MMESEASGKSTETAGSESPGGEDAPHPQGDFLEKGSLTAVAALTKGKTPAEAIKILSGITCGSKNTSCPDQLAQALSRLL